MDDGLGRFKVIGGRGGLRYDVIDSWETTSYGHKIVGIFPRRGDGNGVTNRAAAHRLAKKLNKATRDKEET